MNCWLSMENSYSRNGVVTASTSRARLTSQTLPFWFNHSEVSCECTQPVFHLFSICVKVNDLFRLEKRGCLFSYSLWWVSEVFLNIALNWGGYIWSAFVFSCLCIDVCVAPVPASTRARCTSDETSSTQEISHRLLRLLLWLQSRYLAANYSSGRSNYSNVLKVLPVHAEF